MTFEELDAWRAERGIPPARMAALLGVTSRTYSEWGARAAVAAPRVQERIRSWIDRGGPLGVGRFRRVRDGVPWAATVRVVLFPATASSAVSRVAGEGFRSQGLVETAAPGGYADWHDAARSGALFALESAGACAGAEVVEISGLSTDTVPGAVFAAAASAVWDALGYEPTAEVWRQVEAVGVGVRRVPDAPAASGNASR